MSVNKGELGSDVNRVVLASKMVKAVQIAEKVDSIESLANRFQYEFGDTSDVKSAEELAQILEDLDQIEQAAENKNTEMLVFRWDAKAESDFEHQHGRKGRRGHGLRRTALYERAENRIEQAEYRFDLFEDGIEALGQPVNDAIGEDIGAVSNEELSLSRPMREAKEARAQEERFLEEMAASSLDRKVAQERRDQQMIEEEIAKQKADNLRTIAKDLNL